MHHLLCFLPHLKDFKEGQSDISLKTRCPLFTYLCMIIHIQLFDCMSMTVLANSVSKDNRNSNSYLYI